MTDFNKIREVEDIYRNGNIPEYLKNLSYEELCSLRSDVSSDAMNASSAILNALEDELEYRFLENFLSSKDATFISEEFDLHLNTENYEEIKKSFEILNGLGDYLGIVRWCPSLLFLDKTYRVYSYLKNLGKTDDEIVEFLCQSFEKTMQLAEAVQKGEELPSFSEEFLALLSKIAARVSRSKSGTESYDKYTNKMLHDNETLLKRLS